MAISEWGQVIGLITQSLLTDRKAVELGYMTVITVEPIYVCLADYKLLPKAQAEGWDGLWNSTGLYFLTPGTDVSEILGGLVVASVKLFDDGDTFSVTIVCDDDVTMFERISRTVAYSMPDAGARIEDIRPGMRRFHLPPGMDNLVARQSARQAANAAVSQLVSADYVPMTRGNVAEYFLNPET